MWPKWGSTGSVTYKANQSCHASITASTRRLYLSEWPGPEAAEKGGKPRIPMRT